MRRSCRPVRLDASVFERRAGHVGPEVSRGDLGRIERGDEAASNMTTMRVGQTDQLVEIGGDQQRGEPGGPCGPDVVPDLGLRSDVDAAGRVGGDRTRPGRW